VEDDEVVSLVLVDLRSLVAVPRVLHGERVKLELLRDEVELLALRIRDVEPARMRATKLGKLVRGVIDDRVVLFDQETSGHGSQYARGSGGETANDADELLRVEGLGEVRLSVAAIRLAARVGDAGEDHERDAAQRHAELARERRSVHPGHLHVEDDDRGRVVLHDAERLFAVVRLDNAESTLSEQLALDGE